MNWDFVTGFLSLFTNAATAVLVIYQAFSYGYKKQDLGILYIEFGYFLNSALFFAVLFGPQIFLERDTQAQTQTLEIALYTIALLGSLWLGFQRKAIAENGIAVPPLFLLKWEEIDSYAWEKPKYSEGPRRLQLKKERRFLFCRWTQTLGVDVPGQYIVKADQLVKLYLPYKESGSEPASDERQKKSELVSAS